MEEIHFRWLQKKEEKKKLTKIGKVFVVVKKIWVINVKSFGREFSYTNFLIRQDFFLVV